jgi:hypothetical protein
MHIFLTFSNTVTGAFEEYRNRKYQADIRSPDFKEFRWKQRKHDYSFQGRSWQTTIVFDRKGKSAKGFPAYLK